MKKDLNVNINLPQSELAILRKIAKSLGWQLFIQPEEDNSSHSERQKIVQKLYGCIQVPDNFDYKKELEKSINDKYNL